MAGIGLRQRLGPLSHAVTRQNCDTILAPERIRIESQVPRQLFIQLYEPWRCDGCRVHARVEVLRQPRKRVGKAEANLLAFQDGGGLRHIQGGVE